MKSQRFPALLRARRVLAIVPETRKAVPVRDARGQLALWVGGAANKNKDVFEQRFRKLVQDLEKELKVPPRSGAQVPVASIAGD